MWKFDIGPSSSDSDKDVSFVDAERIMKEIQRLYTMREVGLKEIAKFLTTKDSEVKLVVPRQKITVLIVGHHSPAKQKFIDLYFDESKQGSFISRVNYDKMDKIFITHGNRRKWLSGETVLDHCPHLAQLKNVPGLKEYLTTEIAARQTKSLVSFILAPDTNSELETEYGENSDTNNNSLTPKHLNIEHAIGTLAEAADLIFIFFDPTGNTPPKATLKPFAKLWKNYNEKIHLILAKADPNECTEDDRENILTDIVRQTWRIQEVRDVGYLPLIYCPDLTSGIKDDERLWNIIQLSTDQSVQKALNQLEKDGTKLQNLLLERLAKNEKAKQFVGSPSSWYLWFFVIIAVLLAMSVTEFNDVICRNEASNWKAVCNEMVTSKVFMASVGSIAIFCTLRSLIMEWEPVLLSPDEETLLNRRIQFTNHVLYQKEVIERKYLTRSRSNNNN